MQGYKFLFMSLHDYTKKKFVSLAMNFYELDSYRKHCRQEVLLASNRNLLQRDSQKRVTMTKKTNLWWRESFKTNICIKEDRSTCLWNVISAQFIFSDSSKNSGTFSFVYGEDFLPCSNKITCLFDLKNFRWARKTFFDCTQNKRGKWYVWEFPLLI